MARIKKPIDVQKFGGIEQMGTAHTDHKYELSSGEVQSTTKIEQDEGHGNAAIIRCFEFAMNPQAFRERQPTKQDLFNAHYKGIEVALWKDGLKVLPEVNPRIIFDEKTLRYKIFVGAQPQRGHLLREKPQTLTEIAHG